jgi:hypothetical protein
MNTTPKKRAYLAPVTSIQLLRDRLHVTVLTDQDRRTVKKKAQPAAQKGDAVDFGFRQSIKILPSQ